MKKLPVSAAAIARPPPHAARTLPSPSPVRSAGTRRSGRLSGLSLRELLGRLAPPETSAGGGGRVGVISRKLRSRQQPRTRSPSRRGLGQRARAATAGG